VYQKYDKYEAQDGDPMEKPLKVFLSYSHKDEKFVNEFKIHFEPLKRKGLVEEWYDRKILSGENFMEKIDNNLEDADIICLFISANFLASRYCMEEKERALKLRSEKGTRVIPIILSPCGWLDEDDLQKLLALPTDGKPITKFESRDEAWHDVYKGLKRIIREEQKIRNLRIREDFKLRLENAEMLSKAHPNKVEVSLEDIFVSPNLLIEDVEDGENVISFDQLMNNFLNYKRIVIAGESLSGKTSLCKKLFKKLCEEEKFVPVYLSDKANRYSGKILNKIKRALSEEYEIEDIEDDIPSSRIIPILDDFHMAKDKEKNLNVLLSTYDYCVLTVDDISSLDIRDRSLLKDFTYFRILEFKPTLRYELVKKWVSLKDIDSEIKKYEEIDKKYEIIDHFLGRIIGNGIVPSYSFFILSAIVAYETAIPLVETTSQGYCYQALIYFYLRRQGVPDDEIDIYMNFLTELASYIYKLDKYELSEEDLENFMNTYKKEFTLPIDEKNLWRKLEYIFVRNSLNNFSFRYPYLYYFFVARYIADHIEKEEIFNEVKTIIRNLDVEEKAYIALFLTHHSKDERILKEILYSISGFFSKYSPSTLDASEMRFLDQQIDLILEPGLPPSRTIPESNRAEVRKIEDEIETRRKSSLSSVREDNDSIAKDLRRAIKTAEVLGCIIKNRVGSIKKNMLVKMFTEGSNLFLRLLSSIFEEIQFEEIQKEEIQEAIINWISTKIENHLSGKNKSNEELSEYELKSLAKKIFWNMIFLIILSVIKKAVLTLGSDKLKEIIEEAYRRSQSPSLFLIKHGILMWYNKNLRIDEIANSINKKGDFSETAKTLAKWLVAEHCWFHPIVYKEKQKIESLLGIPKAKLRSKH